MSKVAKTKSVKLKPFEKILVTCLISGKPTSKEEIDALLGHEIYMYRISTYMWHIKTIANGIVKVIKEGRKVSGYQLVNVDEVKEYLKRVGALDAGYAPSAKKVSMDELKQEVVVEQPVAETDSVGSDEMVVTEVTA